MSENYPKEYFTRKLWGPVAFYTGIILILIPLVLFATGHIGGGIKSLAVGAYLFLFGKANRKPRLIVTAREVRVQPNPFGKFCIVPLADIINVITTKKFEIIVKNGNPIRLSKIEFSKKTRQAFAAEAQSRS